MFSLQLSESTQEWAEKLAQSCQFEHRPHPWPNGAQGENITTQFNNSAEKSIDMWIKSPPHNRNVSQHVFFFFVCFSLLLCFLTLLLLCQLGFTYFLFRCSEIAISSWALGLQNMRSTVKVVPVMWQFRCLANKDLSGNGWQLNALMLIKRVVGDVENRQG